MKKLASIFLGIMGLGFWAVVLPVYDLVFTEAWVKGGLMASVLLLALLLAGGLVLMLVAVYLWRRH